MTEIALLYHDVVGTDDFDSSGFEGGDAAIYKLPRKTFLNHLDAIAKASPSVLLTFDDGGVSAYSYIADELEERGWRGYFFVATNWIGKPRFLNRSQIRELRERGHTIGSHSCSHPSRISRFTLGDIIHEWSCSSAVLSDILGEKILTASVPGGYYSEKVARAAALAGLETLFTSEPTVQTEVVEGCMVKGRFMIQRSTSARTAASLARGAVLPQFQQFVWWNSKKVLKAVGGRAWLNFRKRVLNNCTGSL
jgi:peptidoglycan/xylan/chitin deacetylase (PgdA/CDA1 family)